MIARTWPSAESRPTAAPTPMVPTTALGGWVVLFLLGWALLAEASAQPAAPAPETRFRTVDLYVDSGQRPLAAYQLTFEARSAAVKIVGIEGGEAPAFRDPPYYDPQAIQKERVILAAFNTGAAAKLPKGRTRVATIHVRISGPAEPLYEVRLVTAGTVKARKITATVHAEERRKP